MIPSDWLLPPGQTNIIAVFEEIGASNINGISFTVVSMEDVHSAELQSATSNVLMEE